MTFMNDKHGNTTDSITRERSAAVLEAILSNADPATWYPEAPKVRSAWEPFDLCDLRGSNLSNQQIGKVMMAECALDDADFSNALLDKTSFQSSSASRAKFVDAKLHQTQMIPFYGEAVDFTRAVLTQAFMLNSKLLDCKFVSATLDDVSLSQADISRSSLVGARVNTCRLSNAVLCETDLSNAAFSKCDLRNASLQSAIMVATVLEGCEMHGTDFRGATLDRAVISGGEFGIYHQGSKLTPTRFDDTPAARKLVAASGAKGIDSIEWLPAGTVPEAAPKNAPAGQFCPRSGFWFTPAQAGSRRYFQAGQAFPELNSDYGATIWQWDQNQDPPKL